MTTIVKILLTTFADTPFGIFSRLQCGDVNMFSLESPWDEGEVINHNLNAGIYQVNKLKMTDNVNRWYIGSDEEQFSMYFSNSPYDWSDPRCIALGISLSSHDDQWTVDCFEDAIKHFENIVKDINSFTLYVSRPPMNQHYNDK